MLRNLFRNWRRLPGSSAVRQHGSKDGSALLKKAQQALLAGDHVSAVELYRIVVNTCPTAQAWNGLGVALNHVAEFAEAEAAIRSGLLLEPDEPLLRTNLAVSLMRQQRHGEAEIAARAALALDEHAAEAHLVLAESLVALNQMAEADDHYRRCAELDEAFAPCRNVRVAPAFFESLNLDSESQDTRMALAAPPNRIYKHVTIVSSDSRYFEKFGGSFLNSYSQHAGQDSLLHIHLIGVEPTWLKRVQGLAGHLGLETYCVTMEPVPSNVAREIAPTYFACARFIHMARWLRQHRNPIVCLDIDAIVREPPQMLIDGLGGHDLGLALREPYYVPWTNIQAGTVVANATGPAISYFEAVARYIGHFFNLGQAQWALDQTALYCALRYFQVYRSDLRVARINNLAENFVGN